MNLAKGGFYILLFYLIHILLFPYKKPAFSKVKKGTSPIYFYLCLLLNNL